MGFHDFDQYERLLTIARKRGAETYLMILLGGDAGLRLGEIVALEWRDVDLEARRVTVQRSDWLGHVTVPKGGGSRQLLPEAVSSLPALEEPKMREFPKEMARTCEPVRTR